MVRSGKMRHWPAIFVHLVLIACDPNTGSQSSNFENSKAIGSTVLRLGNLAEPMTLDPHLAQGTWEDRIVGSLLMGLTTEDPRGEPIPGAAISWETSPDGLTWTFHLRNHEWSDGTPVTANDFVYAWRRILSPYTASSYAYYLYLIKNAQAVKSGKVPLTALGVTARDDRTLIVQLEHSAPYLPQYMMHFTTFPVPRHVVEEKGEAWARPGNYVSNGPFSLVEWIPNDHVMVQKNPLFYDAGNVELDRVIFYPTVDYEAAMQRFRVGELDVQHRLPSSEIDWLRVNLPETVRIAPMLTTEYLIVNIARKPLDDVRVREALSLALDREAITDKIRRVGEVPAYGVVPPGIANYPGNITLDFKAMSQSDRIDRAQQLMKQAGYGVTNHLKTTLFIRSSSAEARRVPAAIQAMWRAIYVDADLVQNDTAVFFKKLEQGDFDIGATAWGADFNDATTFLDLFRKGNGNNYSQYTNAEFETLLSGWRGEQDLERRGLKLAEAEAILLKDHVWIPEYFWVSGSLVQPYVQGWEENPRDQHRLRWVSIGTTKRTGTAR